MDFLVGLFIDCVLNCSPYTKPAPQVVAELTYNYGTFNQLFAWHNQSIGEM